MKITQSLLLLASFSLSCNAVATVSKVASDVTNMIAQAKSLEQTFNGMNSYNWMIAGPVIKFLIYSQKKIVIFNYLFRLFTPVSQVFPQAPSRAPMI
jgi:hypothetical protein